MAQVIKTRFYSILLDGDEEGWSTREGGYAHQLAAILKKMGAKLADPHFLSAGTCPDAANPDSKIIVNSDGLVAGHYWQHTLADERLTEEFARRHGYVLASEVLNGGPWWFPPFREPWNSPSRWQEVA